MIITGVGSKGCSGSQSGADVEYSTDKNLAWFLVWGPTTGMLNVYCSQFVPKQPLPPEASSTGLDVLSHIYFVLFTSPKYLNKTLPQIPGEKNGVTKSREEFIRCTRHSPRKKRSLEAEKKSSNKPNVWITTLFGVKYPSNPGRSDWSAKRRSTH